VYKEEEEDEKDEDEQEKADIRKLYQENLEKMGVQLEIEPKEVIIPTYFYSLPAWRSALKG